MITKNRILCVLGIWIVLVPFLGFPTTYKTFFVITAGLAVIVLAFLYARSKRIADIHVEDIKHEVVTEVYEENRPVFTTHEVTEDRFTDIQSIRHRSRNIKTL